MKIPFTDEPPVPSDLADEYPVELFREIRKSRKFQRWTPEIAPVGDKLVTERHFSPQELSIAWGCSAEKIRILFRKEPGVLRLPSRGSGNGKRGYVTLKIPESVAIRVHRRLSAIPQ